MSQVQIPVIIESELSVVAQRTGQDSGGQAAPPPPPSPPLPPPPPPVQTTQPSLILQTSMQQPVLQQPVMQQPVMQPLQMQPPQMQLPQMQPPQVQQPTMQPQMLMPPPPPPTTPQPPLAIMATTALPVVQPSPMSIAQPPMPPTPMYSQSLAMTPYASSAPLLGSPNWNQSFYAPNTTTSVGTGSSEETWNVKMGFTTQPSSSSFVSSGTGQMESMMYPKEPEQPWWSPYGYMRRMNQQGNVVITLIFLVGVVACVIAILSRFGAGRSPVIREAISDEDEEARVMHGPWWVNQTMNGTFIEPYGLCRTLECRREGSHLISMLDGTGVCQNFYDYVCARTWKGTSDGTEMSTSDVVIKGVESSIIGYIKSGKATDKIVEGAKSLWKECMDVQTIKKLGKKPFEWFLNEAGLSGWPFGISANVSARSVWNVSATLVRLLSLTTFLSVIVSPSHNGTGVITLERGIAPTLTRDLLDNATMEEFFQSIKTRLRLFEPDDEESDDIANEILRFIQNISSFTDSQSDAEAVSDQSEFHNFASSALSGLVDVNDTGITLKEASDIRSLYKTVQGTPPRTVLNYLGYAAVDHLWLFSPQDKLSPEDISRREHDCIRCVQKTLPAQVHYLGYLATKHNLDVTFFTGVIHDVKHKVIRSIRDIPWMDANTKSYAVKQLSLMRIKAFFPRWMVYNRTRPTLFHPSLTPLEALAFYQSLMKYNFEKAIVPSSVADEDFWLGSVFDRDCTYDSEKNILFLPLSMANTTKGATQFFLYFHIPHVGVKLAKCLLEAVLGEPSKHPTFWASSSVTKFTQIRSCFRDPYTTVLDPVRDIAVDKKLSVISKDAYEHAAVIQAHDVFTRGIRTLTKSFQDYRFANAKDLSAEQLFYVYYASGECESYDSEYVFRRFQERGESPAEQRVNLVLSHDKLFHKAFKCQPGSPMNPKKRCRFW